MMEWIVILIPLLPLLAFLILATFGGRIGPMSHRVTLPAMVGSFILSVLTIFRVMASGPIDLSLYSLIDAGLLRVEVGFYVDQVAAFILLLVTGVSALVHRFSSRYMQGDPRYGRFFALISLFPFAMLMLVMSSNLLVLYFFWEIMGICSYLLISHWADRKAACAAALRVFLINAVSDVGLGLGVLLTFRIFGTLDIRDVLAAAPDQVGRTVDLLSPFSGWLGVAWPVDHVTMITLLFFFGVMGKSAQFPLHIWLPYAMEAPTPVSAMIHAATLVKAGIYLMIRLGPLLILSPAAMTVITIVGGMTAVTGAAVALTQTDIKRTLAYSTISQLGFMTLACGMGAFVAAAFHLLAHGFLKAFFFLSSGSALKQIGHHAQPAQPGRHGRPFTDPAFGGGMVLALLPPLLLVISGYGTLWVQAPGEGLSPLYWFFLVGTSLFAGMYLYRGWEGSSQGLRPAGTFFLVSAAAVVILGGGMAILFHAFSEAIVPAAAVAAGGAPPPAWLALGIGMAWGGAFLAYGFRRLAFYPAVLGASWYKGLYVLIHNKGYLDEIVDAVIVRPTLRLSEWLFKGVDLRVIERGTVGAAAMTVHFSRWLWQSVDIRILGWTIEGAAAMTVRFSRWLWRSVDIRILGWMVEGIGRLTIGVARWLWQSVDLRGFERVIGTISRQNRATGEALRRIEPSMLQHHLLVMIFTLVALMILFLLFFR